MNLKRAFPEHQRVARLAAASVGNASIVGGAGRLLAPAIVALGLLAAPAASAATYKWVDDKGVVHYTDKLPPEVVNKGSVELNRQGVTVRKVEPTLTPEQRRAREANEERQRLIVRERDLVDRRDRALLATYTDESEIDLARHRALSTIEAQVLSSTSYSSLLNKRKSELDAKKAELGDKPAPVVLERELANINSELAKQTELIAAKQKEIVVVNARYDIDKQRWADLRKVSEASPNGTSSATPKTAKQ